MSRYLEEKVKVLPPAELRDLFLAPYYGWVIERLSESIRPDSSQGEAAELPRYESHRGPGSTSDVDFWTSRDVREAIRSHVNFVVADTKKWEQSAAERWVNAVNADGGFGVWTYAVAKKVSDVPALISSAAH